MKIAVHIKAESKKDALRVSIVEATPEDAGELLDILDSIPEDEAEYLALDKKRTFIKGLIRSGHHILLAKIHGKIAGFVRSSDRHGNTIMLEEVYVLARYRKLGIATRLISAACEDHNRAMAKSFAGNKGIVATLTNLGFEPKYSPKGTVISWSKELPCSDAC